MNKFRCIYALAFLAIFSLSASPIFANSVRADLGASGKGVVNPTGGCVATIQLNPACVDFAKVSDSLATWTAFTLTDFDTSTFSTLGPYDLFLVNGVSDGTQVTLTLTGASDVFGSFLCGDDPTMTAQLLGFCSDPDNLLGGDPSSIFSQMPDGTNGANQATFIFNSSTPSTWVFYATHGDATISTGNGTSVPEPSSLLLLAAGLTLAGLKLRRS